MIKLTNAQVLKLAEWHVEHFKDLIKRAFEGQPGIRLSECHAYYALWFNVLYDAKQGADYDKIEVRGQRELREAVESGEFDVMLGFGGDS